MAGAMLAQPASAYEQPPRGGDCRAMMARAGGKTVWLGRFQGGREIEIMFDVETIDMHYDEGCFATKAACERWLYRLKSIYQMYPVHDSCQPLRPAPRR
jgi:hypothetical protein